ncbi:RNA polymerase sigma factor [Wenyingzhuangia sp. IMCC45533]
MTNEKEFIEELLGKSTRDNAFKRLLDMYQERLYWHIRKLVHTHENADDVLQNTFVRIYKSLPNFKQKSSLHTWMYKIAYNESLRLLESNKRHFKVSVDEVSEKHLEGLFEDAYFNADAVQVKLQKVLNSLPGKQRDVFKMKYYDDLKFREISEIILLKEGTVKTLYYKAAKFVEDTMVDEMLVESKI